jgi:hypothetical protein
MFTVLTGIIIDSFLYKDLIWPCPRFIISGAAFFFQVPGEIYFYDFFSLIFSVLLTF